MGRTQTGATSGKGNPENWKRLSGYGGILAGAESWAALEYMIWDEILPAA